MGEPVQREFVYFVILDCERYCQGFGSKHTISEVVILREQVLTPQALERVKQVAFDQWKAREFPECSMRFMFSWVNLVWLNP
ncbi:TPA: hypothetical protein DF272_05695 [Candidatus Falkowbacteria bacterium]|nr:hypothetical protein [Candidatus Falkowbacteria bacterium]